MPLPPNGPNDKRDTPPEDGPDAATDRENDQAIDATVPAVSSSTPQVPPSTPSKPNTPRTPTSKPWRAPRRFRRSAKRDAAKRTRRCQLDALPKLPRRAIVPEPPFDVQSAMLDLAAAEWRAFRKARFEEDAAPSADAIVKAGMVIIRGSGDALDERVALSVWPRLARWQGDHDELDTLMLDGIVFDMLPIVHRDPFDELRNSPFTGALASDEALAVSIRIYQQAYAALSPRHPFIAPDHVEALLQQVCDVEGIERWRYPADTQPLSVLAQRVFLHVIYAASAASKEPLDLLIQTRRLIAHRRLHELIDPRDGAF